MQVIVDAVAVEAAIGKDKDAVEDLMAAKPALDDAENALSAITGKDIGMLKALKPPELIKRLFDCVLVLFQEPLIPCDVEMVKRLQLEVSWALDAGHVRSLSSSGCSSSTRTPSTTRRSSCSTRTLSART